MRPIKEIFFFIIAVALNICIVLLFGVSTGLIFYPKTCYPQDLTYYLIIDLLARLFWQLPFWVMIMGFILLFLITNKNQKKICIIDWILILIFIFLLIPLVIIFGSHGCAF
ncbi:MAG: hypothetical protein ACFE8E_02835 [Candidatus Hodarchaeota archaeon]